MDFLIGEVQVKGHQDLLNNTFRFFWKFVFNKTQPKNVEDVKQGIATACRDIHAGVIQKVGEDM